MTRSRRWTTALAALVLALGSVPALASEGDDIEPDEAAGERSLTDHKFMILFAEGFGTTEGDVIALSELGLGWGEMFKLNVYATALGVSVQELLTDATFDEETGEWDFGWGDLRAGLSDEQLSALEGLPKNLGAVMSEASRHQGRDAHQPAHAGGDVEKLEKGSKPEHAGRGGRSGK